MDCLICQHKVNWRNTEKSGGFPLAHFLGQFCANYLQMNPLKLSSLRGLPVCGKCETLMSHLDEIYKNLRSLEVRLLGKIQELVEVISSHGKLDLLKTTSQSGAGIKFREDLKDKCLSRTIWISPVVKLSRVDPQSSLLPVVSSTSIKENFLVKEEMITSPSHSLEDTNYDMNESEPAPHSPHEDLALPNSDEDNDGEPNCSTDSDDDGKPRRKETRNSSSGRVCRQCGENFPWHKLNEHRVEHDHYVNQQPILGLSKCDHCEMMFTNQQFLYDHCATTHLQCDLLQCDICKEKFEDSTTLRDHLRLTHETPEKPLPCYFCTATFTTPQLCYLHRLFMHPDRSMKLFCDDDTCSEVFTSVQELNTHLRTSHSENIFECKTCHIGFLSKIRRKLHNFNHWQRNIKGKVICSECSRGYANKNLLMPHFNRKHGRCWKIATLQCKKCRRPQFHTFSKKELEFHSNSHINFNLRCIQCERMFSNKEELKIHRDEELHPRERVVQLKQMNTDFTLTSNQQQKVIGRPKGVVKVKVNAPQKLKSSTIDDNPPNKKKKTFRRICKECNLIFNLWEKVTEHRIENDHYQGHPPMLGQARCDLCPIKFSNPQSLLHHTTRKHKQDHLLQCSTCQVKLTTCTELRDHLRQNHEDNQHHHYCPFCPAAFSTEQLCYLHRILMHSGRPKMFSCDDNNCLEEFSSISELNTHMRTAHGDIFQCEVCHLGFLSDYRKLLHSFNHQERNSLLKLDCSKCSFSYDYRCQLMFHFNKNHGAKQKIELYKCENERCSLLRFYTMSKKELQLHQKTHMDQSLRCRVCEQVFSDIDSFQDHHKEIHGNTNKVAHRAKIKVEKGENPIFPCDKCELKFSRKFQLRYHQRTHKDLSLVCHECGKSFRKRISLKHHIQSVHLKQMSACCDQCGKQYTSEVTLKQHVSLVHEKRMSCSFCGKGFNRSRELEAHERQHTGDKWPCSWCKSKFSMIRSRRNHVRMFHPERYQEFVQLQEENSLPPGEGDEDVAVVKQNISE